ncbi:hypothetical protein KI387_038613, partial [Taxus chinensis]
GLPTVEVGVFKELEKRFGILLEFTEKLVLYARDRSVSHVHLVLPNVQALNSPLEPVTSWWAMLREDAGGAYDYLWLGWANADAANTVNVELEEEVSQGLVHPVACVSISMELG